MERYRADTAKQHMSLITPWFSPLFAENRRLLGEDWWPYGLRANRAAVDTFLRYHHDRACRRDCSPAATSSCPDSWAHERASPTSNSEENP
jgi:hypothetical protein